MEKLLSRFDQDCMFTPRSHGEDFVSKEAINFSIDDEKSLLIEPSAENAASQLCTWVEFIQSPAPAVPELSDGTYHGTSRGSRCCA